MKCSNNQQDRLCLKSKVGGQDQQPKPFSLTPTHTSWHTWVFTLSGIDTHLTHHTHTHMYKFVVIIYFYFLSISTYNIYLYVIYKNIFFKLEINSCYKSMKVGELFSSDNCPSRQSVLELMHGWNGTFANSMQCVSFCINDKLYTYFELTVIASSRLLFTLW